MCYCVNDRELGSVELQCHVCRGWYHSRCLKEVEIYGVPFMVSYRFVCNKCELSESFTSKRANMVHMIITTFANQIEIKHRNNGTSTDRDLVFLDIKKDVIPYMDANWTSLTAFGKRKDWEKYVQITITNYPSLFTKNANNKEQVALTNQCLELIGPFYIEDRKRGRDTDDTVEAKKKNEVKQKKTESEDNVQIKMGGKLINHPFTKGPYRYFLSEKNPKIPKHLSSGDKYTDSINPDFRRIRVDPVVSMSEHDRAFQLQMKQLSCYEWRMRGIDGYAMGRCSHFVTKGTWYFEVKFNIQERDSQIRVGWAQATAPVQGPVGYTKLSYGIRSHRGTKFHDSIGKTYAKPGFGQGSIVGCLIHLPPDNEKPTEPIQKCSNLIEYESNLFFEVQDDDVKKIEPKLEVCKGSYIEFFIDGVSCGKAYEDLYSGSYYPAISLFHEAEVTATFGPSFHKLPTNARPMYQRGPEYVNEQSSKT